MAPSFFQPCFGDRVRPSTDLGQTEPAEICIRGLLGFGQEASPMDWARSKGLGQQIASTRN
tara:strand:- start:16807 stop:16989 length:183 start_codon:yes stop_codon:yes gene_type:complete